MLRFDVNMNGDTAKTLKAQGLNVRYAAVTLLDALRAASPHGRNYQTHPDQADYVRDRALHDELIEAAERASGLGYDMAIRAYEQGEDK